MPEFNLLQSFPKVKRGKIERIVTKEIRKVAEKLDFDYYDGDRKYGFGGYVYDGRWQEVAKLAKERYQLNKGSKVLIERSEKGFLVYDLKKLIPGITIYGSHCSEYALNHAMDGFGKYALVNREKGGDPKLIEQQAREEIAPFLIKADVRDLPFRDNYFDTIISINSVCNYSKPECRQVVKELVRISKDYGKNSYIHVDSWRTKKERETLLKWVLLAKTLPNTKGWKRLFREGGYKGDFGFIIFDEDNY